MSKAAETVLSTIADLRELLEMTSSVEQQVCESMRKGFERAVKSVMLDVRSQLLSASEQEATQESYVAAINAILGTATDRLLHAVDGWQGVIKSSLGSSTPTEAEPASMQMPESIREQQPQAVPTQDFVTPFGTLLTPPALDFVTPAGAGLATESSLGLSTGSGCATAVGEVPNSWSWSAEQAVRLVEESARGAGAHRSEKEEFSEQASLDTARSQPTPLQMDSSARSKTGSILKLDLRAAQISPAGSQTSPQGAGESPRSKSGARRALGRSVRLGQATEELCEIPGSPCASPKDRMQGPGSPRNLDGQDDFDMLSPRSRKAQGRRATLPPQANPDCFAPLKSDSPKAEAPFGRRMTAPAQLMNPYMVLQELEGTMKVIFRFFCDPESGELSSDRLGAMIAAQAADCKLLPDSPDEALEYIYDYLDVEAEESLDFLCLYDFVHAYLAEDQVMVKKWVEHLNRHATLLEMQRDAANYFEVLSPRLGNRSIASRTKLQNIVHLEAAIPDFPTHATVVAAMESLLANGDDPRRVRHDFAALLELGHVGSHDGTGLSYEVLRDVLSPQLNFKLGAIFRTLDKRIKEEGAKRPHGMYKAKPLAGRQVVVCGAGPVGLRCAVEMKMLGARVVVVEKRDGFSRYNILHLWDWVLHDLLSLGAKVLYPKFGSGAAFLHIGTRQLQNLLLKVALLLGVDVRFGTEFLKLQAPAAASGWSIRVASASGEEDVPCDLLVDCTGPRGAVCRTCGFTFKTTQMSQAVGLVVNFVHCGTREERLLKEFSWARQFNGELFETLSSKGVDLENVVYYQGETHYFVMTPRRASLLSFGALSPKEGASTKDTALSQYTEDAWKLREYARIVTSHFGIPEVCDFVGDPQLFDFSSRRSADDAIRLITPADLTEGSSRETGDALPVALAGDCLLEPFWPEGLGITRGFMSVLDLCWVCAKTPKAAAGSSTIQKRQKTVKLLRNLGAFTRAQILQDDVRSFSLDPCSRYKGLVPD